MDRRAIGIGGAVTRAPGWWSFGWRGPREASRTPTSKRILILLVMAVPEPRYFESQWARKDRHAPAA
jgi:hypothetical protein